MCGFAFTLNGFYHFARTVQRANELEAAGRMPGDIPILFLAGAEDPVSNNGRGVKTVFRRYQKQGAQTDRKLYDGMRHEILNETDHEQVFADVLAWVEKHVGKAPAQEAAAAKEV